MLTKEISSLQHPIVKKFVKLRTSKKFRYAEKQIPLTGIKLVDEAGEVDLLLTSSSFKSGVSAKQHYQVTEEILKKITGQIHPEPVAALASMPKFVNLQDKHRIVALDRVSDPGNVGTLIRTAHALGFEGMFLVEGCADPFNDKALRSAMGAALHLPLQVGSQKDLLELSASFTPLVADMSGTSLQEIGPIKRPLLILGSEAQGVTVELKTTFPKISIPIHTVESLNVGAAGAILMYHLTYEG